MNILFITRKFPPIKGGMEKYSHDFYNHLSKPKDIIALRKKNTHLLWFIPYAFILGTIKGKKADIIHIGDGLLAPLGLLLAIILKKPVFCTIHGLDVTYNNNLYQKIVIPSLKKLTHLIAVSKNTKNAAIKKGLNANTITVIPNGLSFKSKQKINKSILDQFNIPKDKTYILTAGRLVKRKGHVWFITRVLPRLNNNMSYIIAGDGPEKAAIMDAISEADMEERVFLLGSVMENDLLSLYAASDIFVMPNIKTNESIEGFGIVALEAASQGTPVIGTNIEGLTEAITPETGLLSPADPEKLAHTINQLAIDTQKRTHFAEAAPAYIRQNHDWKILIKKYYQLYRTAL